MLLRAPLDELSRLTRKRPRLFRFVRVLFVLLLLVELIYVIVANLLLTFGGVQKMFASTDAVKADFLRGWTVWPGTLHIDQLKVVVADHNIQCLIALEHAVVDLRLTELPGMVFHATRVRGSGLSLRFRNRVQPEDAKAPSTKALPPVPGFDDPPLYEAYVPAPPIPEAKYNLWTVHIEDVDVGIAELWVEQFRYLGHARARGKFELRPARHLWVGPGATLDLEPGRLLAGADAPFLTGFGGHIDCTVHWFDVRIPQGLEVLRNISAHLDLAGQVAGAEAVRLFADPAADVRVDQTGARLALHVGMDHGVITAPSRVDVRGATLAVRERALRLDANAPWSITASADPAGPGGKLEVRVAHATAGGHAIEGPTRPGPVEDVPPLTLDAAAMVLGSSTRDTAAKDWALTGTMLDIGALTIPDLRLVDALSPGLPVRFRGGSGKASGHISSDAERLSATGTAAVHEVVATLSGSELRGNADVHASRVEVDQRTHAFVLDGDARGAELRLDDTAHGDKCPWAAVHAFDAAGHLSRAQGSELDGNVDGSVEGVVARFGDIMFSGGARVHAATERTPGDHSVLRAAVRASALRFRGGNAARARWVAHAPAASIDATLSWDPHAVKGPVRVSLGRVGATIGKIQMSGDVSAAVDVASGDVDGRSALVSGSVRVGNARLSSEGRKVEGWWAHLAFGPARIRAKENVDFDGTAKAEMRDGLPGLLTLSETNQIPGWLPTVLPLNGLSGTISVHRRCRTTDLGIPKLTGGPLTAQGRISIGPDETRGAVLVQLKAVNVVSAGFAFGGSDSGLSLLAGEGWLKEHLDAAARETEAHAAESCAKQPPEPSCGR